MGVDIHEMERRTGKKHSKLYDDLFPPNEREINDTLGARYKKKMARLKAEREQSARTLPLSRR